MKSNYSEYIVGKVFEEKEQLDDTEHNHNQMKFSSMMAGEKSRMTSSKSQLNDACDSNKKLREIIQAHLSRNSNESLMTQMVLLISVNTMKTTK
jgi:predicted RNA-binding Zn ribbon-like protein